MQKLEYNIESLLKEVKSRPLTEFEKTALMKDAKFLEEYIPYTESQLRALPDKQLVENVYDAMCDYSR